MLERFEIEADLGRKPEALEPVFDHIAIGDLHGNTLKLIYILIEQGILSLQNHSGDYKILKEIYSRSVDKLSELDIATFKKIIDTIKVNKSVSVTLIGDELCDRGQNYFFTLYLLNKLKEKEVSIGITFSNHGIEFIHDYERKEFKGTSTWSGFNENGDRWSSGQGQSLENMFHLIEKGLVTQAEVKALARDGYMTMVKAIDYSVSEDGQLTLYTHAPVGLETIKALAQWLESEYKDSTVADLTASIDAINSKIEKIQKKGKLSKLFQSDYSENVAEKPIPPESEPFLRLIWNRVLGSETVTKSSSGFSVNFVHGHIGSATELRDKGIDSSNKGRHINIDNDLGKHPTLNKKNHVIARFNPMALFQEQLELIQKKANSFKENSKEKAAVTELIMVLTQAKQDFLKGEINTSLFKEKCVQACSKAENSELKNHRGFKKIIAHIV